MDKKVLTKGEQWVVKLIDPYEFEGKTIETVDLNGLFDLTGRDICQIDDQMLAKGYSGQGLELTKQYALFTVAKVCKQPWEYCDNMKARDVIRIKNIVSNFFYSRA
nr:MAG TPA: tail assembly chaperone protein [Caudoviricetes sp.]